MTSTMAKPSGGPSRHLEIERKFDVSESTMQPSFEGLASISRVKHNTAQTLDAVYLDTPERDLAAHSITLRRRTGGPDAGWHLKLPAGPDARTEVRAPLGEGDGVPDKLRDVVLAIVRDRPLQPVARITTNRSVDVLYGAHGKTLAEFCDDQVTAWAAGADEEQRWREWELELSDGGSGDAATDTDLLDRLANRLHDAGAVPAGHGSKLARVLDTGPTNGSGARPNDLVHRAVAEQVEGLLTWDRAVRADAFDSVHQMRVTTRKIRSLLQASEDSFGLTDDAWVLEELRQLAAVLGQARDAEVLAERYERALATLPAELLRGRVHERLVDGARRRYRSGLRKSLAAMRSERYFRLLDALEGLVGAQAEPPAEAAEQSTAGTIKTGYKRIQKNVRAAEEAETEHRDEALHRIRKSAKKLRYTAEATGAKKVADSAKSLQTLLGDHQDACVSRSHLTHQAQAARTAGEDTFTYGLLYQREADLAELRRAEVGPALKALDKAVKRAL
jgi:CHAD domain-containing protein